MNRKHIYVGALTLVLIAIVFPPVYDVNETGVRFNHGWALVTDQGAYLAINAPLLFTEFIAIGFISFLLVRIFSDR